MREIIDFDRIPERQSDIHDKLTAWGKWCKPSRQSWMVSPMFRQYRSHAWQWETPEVKIESDPNECFLLEKIIASLPEKHREALRWYYVRPISPTKIANHLAVSTMRLFEIVIEARDMAWNRLKQSRFSGPVTVLL